MIDGRNIFDQPIKNDQITYDNIWKIATDQEDDNASGFLLDYFYFKKHYNPIATDLSKQPKLYFYFKEHYMLIAIDLSKQQKLDADVHKQYNKSILLET